MNTDSCKQVVECNKKMITSTPENNSKINMTEQIIVSSKMLKTELMEKCKELGITKCSSKTKSQLIELIHSTQHKKISAIEHGVAPHPLINTTSETPAKYTMGSEDTPLTLKFIDLFCGIGGFHQALKNINGECVFACDIDKTCRAVYEENYHIKPESDITAIDIDTIPPFDVLCAGFPCQPFSKAGHQKGFNDVRGNLFYNICDIIKIHNPKYLLLENVRNLSSHDEGNTWKVIYENITALGYLTYKLPLILNVLHFNVPQNRERVIIMCKRADLGELCTLPVIPKNPKRMLTMHLKDIICETSLKYSIGGKLQDTETIWNAFIHAMIVNNIDIPKFPIWTDWWDNPFEETNPFYIKYKSWIDKNRKFYQDNKEILQDWLTVSRTNINWVGAVRKFEWQAGELTPTDGMNTLLWSSRGSGIRVKRCDYIPTLVAMSMTPIYGPERRRLSPRELLRLQSFPDDFRFTEKTIYKQVGNSVNVKMIEKCARFLILNQDLF
jgi:DNA (cytosine-5)-methyltransferase 1